MSEAAAELPQTEGSGFWIRYGVPAILALVVHAMAVLALVEGWSVSDETRFAPRVEVLDARLIELEPQAPAAAEVVERPTVRETPPAPTPAPERTAPAPQPRVAEAPAAEVEPEPAPEPAAPEPEATRQSDFEDDALRELLEQSLADAIASEQASIDARRAESAVASYIGTIVRRIQQVWSRPPSARNGMQASLLLGLVPTGEVVSVEVVESSGNTAFDRSARDAVRAAAPFEVPTDPALFEREFRNLTIVFRPEDLRN